MFQEPYQANAQVYKDGPSSENFEGDRRRTQSKILAAGGKMAGSGDSSGGPRHQLYGGVKRWLCESLEILKKHYLTVEGVVQAQLLGMDLAEGERALEVARRWARRNLRNKRVLGAEEKTFSNAQIWEPMINFNWLL